MKQRLFILLLMGFHLQLMAQDNPDTKPSGKIVGEVFGDFYYKVAGDTGTTLTGPGEYQTTEKNANAFAIRRFNLGYDYTYNEKFSARILVEGNDGTLLPNANRSVYIKIAQVSWNNIFPGSNLIIGSQSTLTWPRFSERVWAYRKVEKTIMDFRKLGSSFDFGVSLEGSFNKSETLGYSVMIGNGTAQRPETDKHKKYYASIHGKFLDKKLWTEIYFDHEPFGSDGNTTTLKGFIGWQESKLSLGLEPFRQVRHEEGIPNVVRTGIALFGHTALSENVVLILRTDYYNSDSRNTGYKEMFFLAGTDFKVSPNISLIPNIWINTYSAETSEVEDRKSDVVGRITFAFKMQ